MRMAANSYTPVSDKLIPTGEIASVAGTVFDLRTPTQLGQVRVKWMTSSIYMLNYRYCLNVLVVTTMDLITTLYLLTLRVH